MPQIPGRTQVFRQPGVGVACFFYYLAPVLPRLLFAAEKKLRALPQIPTHGSATNACARAATPQWRRAPRLDQWSSLALLGNIARGRTRWLAAPTSFRLQGARQARALLRRQPWSPFSSRCLYTAASPPCRYALCTCPRSLAPFRPATAQRDSCAAILLACSRPTTRAPTFSLAFSAALSEVANDLTCDDGPCTGQANVAAHFAGTADDFPRLWQRSARGDGATDADMLAFFQLGAAEVANPSALASCTQALPLRRPFLVRVPLARAACDTSINGAQAAHSLLYTLCLGGSFRAQPKPLHVAASSRVRCSSCWNGLASREFHNEVYIASAVPSVGSHGCSSVWRALHWRARCSGRGPLRRSHCTARGTAGRGPVRPHRAAGHCLWRWQ